MYKIGINFQTAKVISETSGEDILSVLKNLKLTGISSLDILYDDLISNNTYSNILSSGLEISSVYYMGDLSILDSFSNFLKIIDDLYKKRIKNFMVLPIVSNNIEDNYMFNLKHNLKLIVKYAKNFDVQVALENYGLNEPFSSVLGIKSLLKAVKGIGFVYDSGNFYLAGENPYNAYCELENYITRIHLKDMAISKIKDKFSQKTKNGEDITVYPLGEGDSLIDSILNSALENDGVKEFVLEGVRESDMLVDTINSIIYLKTKFNDYEN